jgi:hypothetical protein
MAPLHSKGGNIVDSPHFQLRSPKRQHSLCWDHTRSKKNRLLRLSARAMLELAIGVSTYDALSSSHFALHAYIITAFGDIPAISMHMHIKGHNSLCPCGMCGILGTRIPGRLAKQDALRAAVPPQSSRTNRCCRAGYHPEELPLRSHDFCMVQAKAVESATTEIWREELAKAYGIKGSGKFSS